MARHIDLISAAVAILFAIGSSGLAVVIHTCSMSLPMACCQTMMDDVDSGSGAQSKAPNIPSVQMDMSCSTTSVAGGLTTNPGVVDNNRPVQKVSVVIVPISGCLSIVQTQTSSFLGALLAESASPPSVEKSILNSTFLI